MSTNLSDFLREFVKNGKTDESYGGYYVVGKNAQVVMSAEEGNPDTAKVVLIRLLDLNGKAIIFFNAAGINSNKYQNQTLARSAAQFGNKVFEYPCNALSIENDLTALKVIDQNADDEYLFELPTRRLLLTRMTKKPSIRETVFSAGKEDTCCVVINAGSITTIAEAKAQIFPEDLPSNAIFVSGILLVPTGWSVFDKPEFLPSNDDIRKLKDKPCAVDFIPCLDTLLGIFTSYLDYDYANVINDLTKTTSFMPSEKDKAIKAFDEKIKEWTIFSEKFANTYMQFDRKMFGTELITLNLISNDRILAHFYNDGENQYITGVLQREIGYNRALPTTYKVLLPTWHKIISVQTKILDRIGE